jgi:hypothetical protein
VRLLNRTSSVNSPWGYYALRGNCYTWRGARARASTNFTGKRVNQALALNNAVERPNPVLDSLMVVKQ